MSDAELMRRSVAGRKASDMAPGASARAISELLQVDWKMAGPLIGRGAERRIFRAFGSRDIAALAEIARSRKATRSVAAVLAAMLLIEQGDVTLAHEMAELAASGADPGANSAVKHVLHRAGAEYRFSGPANIPVVHVVDAALVRMLASRLNLVMGDPERASVHAAHLDDSDVGLAFQAEALLAAGQSSEVAKLLDHRGGLHSDAAAYLLLARAVAARNVGDPSASAQGLVAIAEATALDKSIRVEARIERCVSLIDAEDYPGARHELRVLPASTSDNPRVQAVSRALDGH